MKNFTTYTDNRKSRIGVKQMDLTGKYYIYNDNNNSNNNNNNLINNDNGNYHNSLGSVLAAAVLAILTKMKRNLWRIGVANGGIERRLGPTLCV